MGNCVGRVAKAGDEGQGQQEVWAQLYPMEGPQPGTAEFVPTKEWLSQKLHVPVSDVVVKEMGTAGFVTKKVLRCNVTYTGPQPDPSFGMPTELFVKLRQPGDPVDMFLPEMVVGHLAQNMTEADLPVARILWAGPDSCIQEFVESSSKPFKEEDDRISAEVFQDILKTYAYFHACFWNLQPIPGLFPGFFSGDDEWWNPAAMFPAKEQRGRIYECLGSHRGGMEKMFEEVGVKKVLEHMRSYASTLCQGDAKLDNVLKVRKHSSYAEKKGRWELCDFGCAMVSNPAIDVGCFLCFSLKDAEFAAVWKQCLKVYWDALAGHLNKKNMVPDMTFEQFVAWAVVCCAIRLCFIIGFTFPHQGTEEEKKETVAFWSMAMGGFAQTVGLDEAVNELVTQINKQDCKSAPRG
eukprot:TRINITY_DN65391_c0_g1_i1.p1 TRINITY_DN65391_c0_g1~~TRINITY_DN65391_c0_g1_i1.p1  ORF type:complete len:407 (+),score=76.04 TRINITY_DN65391_c0_g1_i1:40-1260(+)